MKPEIKNAFNHRVMISLYCLLFTMILVFVNRKVNAQENISYFNSYRHTIYFESIGATGFGASINYKHSIWINSKTSLNASVGIGCILYSFNQRSDMVVPFSCTLVHGSRNSFEWGGGISIITDEKIYAPNFLMGYRHQKESFFLWIGVVGLFFYASSSNYTNPEYHHTSRWSWMDFAPVPGVRLGRSF